MKKNVGKLDLIIRICVSITLATLYFTETVTGVAGIVLLILSITIALSGIIGFCPFYVLFGINTCPVKQSK
ncbi:MAG: hypothetical protein CMC35_05635 [Flavobacteriaceae bacterium]|nr:hypothetical protein [Flavobacteriaceae bacterium]|tara:strand:+ start:61798 stop:62010 length:213 start_codon:yes stop_codon:yes gene_type:complete